MILIHHRPIVTASLAPLLVGLALIGCGPVDDGATAQPLIGAWTVVNLTVNGASEEPPRWVWTFREGGSGRLDEAVWQDELVVRAFTWSTADSLLTVTFADDGSEDQYATAFPDAQTATLTRSDELDGRIYAFVYLLERFD